jgi:hypothetical protein
MLILSACTERDAQLFGVAVLEAILRHVLRDGVSRGRPCDRAGAGESAMIDARASESAMIDNEKWSPRTTLAAHLCAD